MKLDTMPMSLPIYEALASNVRLQIINLLAVQEAPAAGITISGNEHCRVTFVPVEHVNDAVAQVVARKQPVLSKLSLEAEIPLIDVRLGQIPWK